ncbi:MAG: hypothetical protein CMK32_04585 [Porticoccaceae bacterium]|nr:hypothetical protein [Porticoccaceae bacterium]
MLLALGALNGLVHALDADHVLAVSAVAMQGEARRRRVLFTALEWALGHGASLLFIALMVLGLGMAVPERLAHVAEVLVGVILIAVGVSLLRGIYRGQLHASAHKHPHLPVHFHLHRDGHRRLGDHKSVLIGIVHGIAGSAPLLAVLPLVIQSRFVLATGYILIFTGFVAVMMCAFGGLLGLFIKKLQARYRNGVGALQCLVAVQSLVFGGLWVYRGL